MFLCSCSFATKSSSVQRRVQRRFRGLRQRQWWWHRKQRWSFEGNSRPTQWSSGGTVKSYSSLVIQQIAGSTFVCDDLVVGLRVYPCVLGLGFSCHWYDFIDDVFAPSKLTTWWFWSVTDGGRPPNDSFSHLYDNVFVAASTSSVAVVELVPTFPHFWMGFISLHPMWPMWLVSPLAFPGELPLWRSLLALRPAGGTTVTTASGLDQQQKKRRLTWLIPFNSYWNWHLNHLNWHLYQFLLVFVAQFMQMNRK